MINLEVAHKANKRSSKVTKAIPAGGKQVALFLNSQNLHLITVKGSNQKVIQQDSNNGKIMLVSTYFKD